MKPKEYLMGALRLKSRYEHALEDLEYIRSMAAGVEPIRYDKERVQTSPERDKMAEYMVKLDKAESKAQRLSEAYFNKYMTIRAQIEIISPQIYADLLYLRYIKGMRLWQIGDELGYTYEWIRTIHGRALLEFGRMFPDALKEHT